MMPNNTLRSKQSLPVVALTMGDVAGVGPEVLAAAVVHPEIHQLCRPLVVGDPVVLARASNLIGSPLQIQTIASLEELDPQPTSIAPLNSVACWNPCTVETSTVPPGQLDPRAGAAAYEWLISATAAALAGQVAAIVTAPLNKAALHLAGHHYPGHTEILAERCGVDEFAMMLYLPAGDVVQGPHGLGVAHVTLHTSIASVPGLLSTRVIHEKIHLVHSFLKQIGCDAPRIGVCALNPHAGEGGLFGNEEATLIAPAVQAATSEQVQVVGPLPADTLLQRAVTGAFDGIVAMYHDQGHIALKLIAFQRAVNVTLGLPIVRTSPSHGTAFDIAWKNQVETTGMLSAIRVAIHLCKARNFRTPISPDTSSVRRMSR